jgi:ATP-dependent RNA helicase RhlE
MAFATLGLSDVLFHPLARLGYAQPTAVQTKAIPVVLGGRDLMARAQTGTGKTAAFGLPMIDRLLVRGPQPRIGGAPRGVVVVPTRELAVQVHQALMRYDLSRVEVLTLDEADRMLDMGFLPALRRIIAATPRTRQTLLFSATLPREVSLVSTEDRGLLREIQRLLPSPIQEERAPAQI